MHKTLYRVSGFSNLDTLLHYVIAKHTADGQSLNRVIRSKPPPTATSTICESRRIIRVHWDCVWDPRTQSFQLNTIPRKGHSNLLRLVLHQDDSLLPSIVEADRRFKAMMMEAVRTSETSVYFNEIIRRYIPEGCLSSSHSPP
jgi:hypothetical protein